MPDRARRVDATAAALAAYYERTAGRYDAAHVGERDEHGNALWHILAYVRMLGLGSLLDVGCGTGRAARFFAAECPGLRVTGSDFSGAQLAQATRNGVPVASLAQASAYALPFRDGAFDAVCAFGLLHHVADPAQAVREMTRVARRAVFISDSNRFGQGRPSVRILKVALHRLGLWGLANLVKTRGKGYLVTEEDGISYSYSVFDSYPLLHGWAGHVVLVATERDAHASWYPLLGAGHVLACALREDAGSGSPCAARS